MGQWCAVVGVSLSSACNQEIYRMCTLSYTHMHRVRVLHWHWVCGPLLVLRIANTNTSPTDNIVSISAINFGPGLQLCHGREEGSIGAPRTVRFGILHNSVHNTDTTRTYCRQTVRMCCCYDDCGSATIRG